MLKYNLPGRTPELQINWHNFCSMIDVFAEQITTQSAYDLASSIVKTSGVISDTYLDRSPENMSKQDNVQELLKAIQEVLRN